MTQLAATESRIPVRWLPWFRLLWVGFAILLFALYFTGLGPRYQELAQVCQTEECSSLTLTSDEFQIIENLGLSLKFHALFQLGSAGYYVVIFSAIAGLIFWRRSDTWVGLIVSLALLFAGLEFFNAVSRDLTRLFPNLQTLADFLTSISVVLFMLLFFLFPDGRFTPRWLGWVTAVPIGIIMLDPLVNQSDIRTPSATLVIILAFMVSAPLGMFSQIYRFRKVSNPTQRQQTKWVLLGLMSMFAMVMVWIMIAELEIVPLPPGVPRLIFYFSLLPQSLIVGLFPLAVAISIMRYRLWDIDVIIRRTLVYAVLTAVLALVYFGSVLALQSVITAVGGQQSAIVTVISTLAIAALFTPLRRRVQDFIDRRFFRAKYDAEQTLAAFAATARDEVDMERLAAALLGVVEETMQPVRMSLWLNPTGVFVTPAVTISRRRTDKLEDK